MRSATTSAAAADFDARVITDRQQMLYGFAIATTTTHFPVH